MSKLKEVLVTLRSVPGDVGHKAETTMPASYQVVTYSYCGMVVLHGEFDSIEDARGRAAKRLRWLRKQYADVSKIGDYEWEVGEPLGCLMVPDFCGILKIKLVINRDEEPDEDPEDFDCDETSVEE